MKKSQYTLAGWLAITSVILFCPLFAISITYDIRASIHHTFMPVFFSVIVLLTVVQTACSIYAFYQFKHLLNQRYQYHDADILIMVMIIGTILITTLVLPFKAFTSMPMNLVGLVPVIFIGVPISIVGIVFGVKLLRLNHSLHGLLKPLAFTNIAACCCFMTVLLAPIGMLLAVTFDLLLGVAFLRGEEKDTDPEFV
jgi:hypothetical protein